MIKEPPLLTLRRKIDRAPADLVEFVRGTPTGFVVDCLAGRGALDYRVKPLDLQHADCCGPALTCASGPADNLGLFGAVATAEPGDVIVCSADAFTGTCVTGDQLLGMARNRGVQAFVTDGLVRDVPGILKVGIPVYCAGISPNSPVRGGPGTVGMPIVCGGVTVEAGDLVVGDRDGVVIVPKAMFDMLPARLTQARADEAALDAAVIGGLEMMDSISELLASERVAWVD